MHTNGVPGLWPTTAKKKSAVGMERRLTAHQKHGVDSEHTYYEPVLLWSGLSSRAQRTDLAKDMVIGKGLHLYVYQ